MTTLSSTGAIFLGTVLEGLFYGIYAVLFVLFLTLQRYRKKTTISGPLTPVTLVLFVLCTLYIAMDISEQYFTIVPDAPNPVGAWGLNLATSTVFSIVDFVTQMILIYRCWIIWGRRYLVVAVPALLSFGALGGGFASVAILRSGGVNGVQSILGSLVPTGVASFSLSLAVNTLVTGLIVIRIWIIHRQTRDILSRSDNSLRIVIAMMIESGILIFFTQLIWVVLFALDSPAGLLVGGPILQIYGITPTILAVRVSLGASFESQPETSSLEFRSEVPTQTTRSYPSRMHGIDLVELTTTSEDKSNGSLQKV